MSNTSDNNTGAAPAAGSRKNNNTQDATPQDATPTPESIINDSQEEDTQEEGSKVSLWTWIASITGMVIVVVSLTLLLCGGNKALDVTAASAKYFTSVSEVKQAFETSMWRTWGMEYERRAEALCAWCPSYRALYVEHGLASSKEEALMFAYGLVVTAYIESGYTPEDAYRTTAAASLEELKELIKAKASEEDCEAVLRALM